ncbi:MAG TPA: N-acyl homoserine lactonase family protein [Gemmatimonadaceae bacterium]|nr:N-acyl homoserine lactonase family protein [Gemmatimonadaceae bacterium]
MEKTSRKLAIIAAFGAAVLAVACRAKPSGLQAGGVPIARPTYDVYAIRYATVKDFLLNGLLAGAEAGKRTDLAMMVWLLEGSDGHDVLVDAGFHRQDFLNRWHPADFVPPSEAVERAGVKPEDVSDIIISHIHWDHLDGIDLFPKARIWIQREEFEHHTDSAGTVKDRAIDAGDAKLLAQAAREGRLKLIDGDGKEIMPGITVYTGGKHTFASQFAAVRTTEGTVVVASDNAYLYANLEQHRPIAQTLDSLSNLRAQARMLTLAASPRLIVPGHDPQVFVRFPLPGNGVARIR